jgi:2-polyprenyl-6-methoxyphenol hydroxylase-like FAD-dependent oxidoreductase
MRDADHLDALIVGAGPTGLALACQCLRLGLRVRLIDLKRGPSTTSKAIGLQYRVSEVLALMGVVDRFLARGGTPTNVNIYAGDRRLVRLKFDGCDQGTGRDAFAPKAIMLPQSETEAILGEAVRERGGRIEWGTEFMSYEQDADRVVARLRYADGREGQVAASWLVSCEGAHSVARKQTGIAFSGKTYPLAFFMADVELDWPVDHAENHVWCHKDGSFAALPLPAPRTWRLFVEVTPDDDRPPEAVTLEAIRELMAQRLGDRTTLVTNPTWISEFRIHCRMVDRYRDGRVFLAGDAAHIHSPTGGQGIATGIQDAANLAWKLGRVVGGAPEALLDTYEQERLPQAREVLKATDRTTTIFFAPTPLTRMLRDFVVLPVLNNAWVQRRMFATLAQLHVNYRRSGLSGHADARWWRGGTRVKAGDRAPDVTFGKAEGDTTTLFGLLQPGRPVVLLSPGPAGPGAEDLVTLADALGRLAVDAYLLRAPGDQRLSAENELADLYDDFRRLYGMTGRFLCLVRPDGHVGLFQRPVNEGRLRDYLEKLCSGTAVAGVWPTRGTP